MGISPFGNIPWCSSYHPLFIDNSFQSTLACLENGEENEKMIDEILQPFEDLCSAEISKTINKVREDYDENPYNGYY